MLYIRRTNKLLQGIDTVIVSTVIAILSLTPKNYTTPVFKSSRKLFHLSYFPTHTHTQSPLHKLGTKKVLSKAFLTCSLVKSIQTHPLVLNPKQNPRCTSLKHRLKISMVPVLSISPHCNIFLTSLAAEDLCEFNGLQLP